MPNSWALNQGFLTPGWKGSLDGLWENWEPQNHMGIILCIHLSAFFGEGSLLFFSFSKGPVTKTVTVKSHCSTVLGA